MLLSPACHMQKLNRRGLLTAAVRSRSIGSHALLENTSKYNTWRRFVVIVRLVTLMLTRRWEDYAQLRDPDMRESVISWPGRESRELEILLSQGGYRRADNCQSDQTWLPSTWSMISGREGDAWPGEPNGWFNRPSLGGRSLHASVGVRQGAGESLGMLTWPLHGERNGGVMGHRQEK